MTAARLFISYAHEDESFRDELVKHLKPLEQSGDFAAWNDRQIPAGAVWQDAIDSRIAEADIVLFLVSADFFASDYIHGQEMSIALKRQESGDATIIPIVIRSVLWEHTPLAKFQALPPDAKPVEQWKYRAQAWTEVVTGILRAANGGLGIREEWRKGAQDNLSRHGLSPELVAPPGPTADASGEQWLPASDHPAGDAVNWKGLDRLRQEYPNVAEAVASYRRSRQAFLAQTEKCKTRSNALINSELPIEMMMPPLLLNISDLTAEKLKCLTAELTALSAFEEATKRLSASRGTRSLDPRSFGFSRPREAVWQMLHVTLQQYKQQVEAASQTIEIVQNALTAPIRDLLGE